MSSLRRAVEAFLNAPHPDHFAARLGDEELAALNAMKAALVPPTHSPAPWRRGLTSDSVVSDQPPDGGRTTGTDHVTYYSGFCVAESVAPSNLPVILVAPEALALLREFAAWWEEAGCEFYGAGRANEDGGLEGLAAEAAAIVKRAEEVEP